MKTGLFPISSHDLSFLSLSLSLCLTTNLFLQPRTKVHTYTYTRSLSLFHRHCQLESFLSFYSSYFIQFSSVLLNQLYCFLCTCSVHLCILTSRILHSIIPYQHDKPTV
ncbi:hypothetical protein BDF19DRAFT_313870 [Syncephalis fuscata]|nr:hypothetical protein BDF19DRAFT_313870 [Syncephalis fuscata]